MEDVKTGFQSVCFAYIKANKKKLQITYNDKAVVGRVLINRLIFFYPVGIVPQITFINLL